MLSTMIIMVLPGEREERESGVWAAEIGIQLWEQGGREKEMERGNRDRDTEGGGGGGRD